MIEKPKCNRCGQCCIIYTIDGETKPCKYLQGTPGEGHKTICRIFKSNSRIGVQIDKGKYCGKREWSEKNYPGCPYNKTGLTEREKGLLEESMKENKGLMAELSPI